MRYFMRTIDESPVALCRIAEQAMVAEVTRLGDGGAWESMPSLVRLVYGDNMEWDEIDEDEAMEIYSNITFASVST